jgi:hypothetical protein
VMLDETRDVGVILKHKDGLAQAEDSFLGWRDGAVARSALSVNGAGQTECKSCVNSGRRGAQVSLGWCGTEVQLSWRILAGIVLRFVCFAGFSDAILRTLSPEFSPEFPQV